MCVYVALFACITITQSHAYNAGNTPTHKAVKGHVEAKMLLSSKAIRLQCLEAHYTGCKNAVVLCPIIYVQVSGTIVF